MAIKEDPTTVTDCLFKTDFLEVKLKAIHIFRFINNTKWGQEKNENSPNYKVCLQKYSMKYFISAFLSNFDKQSLDNTTYKFEYDYDSIMHYGKNFFRYKYALGIKYKRM